MYFPYQHLIVFKYLIFLSELHQVFIVFKNSIFLSVRLQAAPINFDFQKLNFPQQRQQINLIFKNYFPSIRRPQ